MGTASSVQWPLLKGTAEFLGQKLRTPESENRNAWNLEDRS
jgi:hypothetical protein